MWELLTGAALSISHEATRKEGREGLEIKAKEGVVGSTRRLVTREVECLVEMK